MRAMLAPQPRPGSLAGVVAHLREERALRKCAAAPEEWVCAVCGFRGPEQQLHRLAGIHLCPSKKWRREPVRRREVAQAELVDRPLSPEHAQALAHGNADEARRHAADALDRMRRSLRALRLHWEDALQHAALAQLNPTRGAYHDEEGARAHAAAAATLEDLRRDFQEVEQQVRDAGIVDEAAAIAEWNGATGAWRRNKKSQERAVPELGAAVDASLLAKARMLVVEAEAEPTAALQDEVRVFVRDLTGFGERAGRWERSAARANERRTREAPLLAHAGLVPQVTPEERREGQRHGVVAGIASDREHDQEVEQRARAYRALVADVVSPAELAELEAHRATRPNSPEYGADFWHTEARQRSLVPEDPVWAKVRELEAAHRARTARASAEAAAQGVLLDD